MMKRLISFMLVVSQLICNHQPTFSQSRWLKSYFGNLDTPVHCIGEAYDKGYLMSGKFGANYSKYNWLIKTDINGNILWQKTIGNGQNAIVFVDIAEDLWGNIYLVGSTLAYEPQGDPLIIKINPCGEKEWCRIFYTENNHDFSSCITLTPDGEPLIVLNLSNPDHSIERLCQTKLSTEGELLWKKCYTSTDTSQRGEDSFDVILTSDNGSLITGFCYYEDPEVPNLWRIHPYILKTDSLGNFEWETVVFKETNLHGGIANNTVISPNGHFYYSSISHYNNSNNFASPALLKLDLQGNVIEVYDIVTDYKEGKLSYAQFLNDSILAASAGWGNTDEDLWSRAVIIDTFGNLLNSTVLMEDLYTSILQITYDGKLLYASNTYQNNQFDCYLTKLNQELEDDTLYTFPFTYDSLCPYQIESDTIVQDDCGLIVGIEEQGGGEAGKQGGMEAWGHGSMEVWPNPARDIVDCRWSNFDGRWEVILVIYDIFGRIVLSLPPTGGRVGDGGWRGWTVDISALPPGIYVAVVRDERTIIGTAKFVVAR